LKRLIEASDDFVTPFSDGRQSTPRDGSSPLTEVLRDETRDTQDQHRPCALSVHNEHEPKNPPPQEEPLTITISEARRRSGLGETTLWRLIGEGRLEAVRPPGCRRTLITYHSLVDLLTPEHCSQLAAPAAQIQQQQNKTAGPTSG